MEYEIENQLYTLVVQTIIKILFEMKRLIFLFLISSNMLVDCISQTRLSDSFPYQDGKILYTRIVQIDSAGKDELYNRAKRWIADSFNSAKDVIQLDNKENGEIICKGFFTTTWHISSLFSQEVNVWHTLKIQLKDNRTKVDLYNIRLKYIVDLKEVDLSLENWIDSWDNNKKRPKQNDNDFILSINVKSKDQINSIINSLSIKNKEDW